MNDSKKREFDPAESLNRAVMREQAEYLQDAEDFLEIDAAEMARRLDVDFETYKKWRTGEEPDEDWVYSKVFHMRNERSEQITQQWRKKVFANAGKERVKAGPVIRNAGPTKTSVELSEDQTQLKKIIFWALVVFLVIVVGNLAVFGVRYYFVQQAVDDLNETVSGVTAEMTARSQEHQKRQQAESEKDAQIQFEQDTLCALNNDSGACICISRQTGQRISLEHDDCVRRATSAGAP